MAAIVHQPSGPLFTKWRAAYRNISRSLEATRLDVIMVVAVKFDRHFDSAAAERIEESKSEYSSIETSRDQRL